MSGSLPRINQQINIIEGSTGIPTSVGLPENETLFSIYPTITSGVLFMETSSAVSERWTFSICDLQGRKIMGGNVNDPSGRSKIDVSDLQDGQYVIISDQDPTIFEIFIKIDRY